MTPSLGKVYLVGSGPGDPGLITLRGAQLLSRANAVLYDYLVNPLILAHANRSAELICLGRHGHGRLMPQSEINARLVELARQGRTVVRLKSGDPVVFARATEEIATLEAAGISYEIVPGITAALAAGSYAGIPLTVGDGASAVALVTGQEREDKAATSLDFEALATFPGTLVFYMGITTAQRWTTALVLAGKAASTPAAIIRRCSWPDQQVIACSLGTVADEIEARRLRPPALVIVGSMAKQSAKGGWFAERPLLGTRVLVTRATGQGMPLVGSLGELGADVLVQPAIEIGPPEDWAPVDLALASLERFNWLVFSSSNGVTSLLDRLLASRDLRALGQVKLAAIGPGTADTLAAYHLRADLVPNEYRAESLAAALMPEAAAGRHFLLVRASRGREVLRDELQAAGGQVEQVVAYASTDVPAPDPQIAQQLQQGTIDWITVTSSAIARSLIRMFGNDLRRAQLASISPLTSEVLREHGFEPSAEASVYTTAGLVQAIQLSESAARGGKK